MEGSNISAALRPLATVVCGLDAGHSLLVSLRGVCRPRFTGRVRQRRVPPGFLSLAAGHFLGLGLGAPAGSSRLERDAP